jgi:putative intracellular protease/amidase
MIGQVILFIVTSHGFMGDSGIPTGWYLAEVAHPYNALVQNFSLVIASPLGGPAPMDPRSQEDCADDPECISFLANPVAMAAMQNTLPLSVINPSDYAGVFFPGGHGPMFDMGDNADAQRIAKEVYEEGGVVAAVCHGPAGIVNAKLSNGQYLISGRNVTGFTNSEEDESGWTQYMPWMLEDRMKVNGGRFTRGPNFQEHVVVDGRLITGQNPNSAGLLAREIIKALSN